ncbi:MAG: hypothetical protein LBI35_01315 [Burkholderiales bacterium]|jgi:hypothetical protein|nr:hypothetical protein [Burkholderiales bacterium]
MLLNSQENNWLYQLWMRLNPDRVLKIDLLDEPISSRLSLADAQAEFALLAQVVQTRATPRKIIIIDTVGSGNFTVPNDVYLIWLSMCAGGGGGAIAGSTSNGAGASGGSSSSIIRLPMVVTPGQIIPYIVGTGGSYANRGTTSGSLYAGSGTESVFGDLKCAPGKGAYSQYDSSVSSALAGVGTAGITPRTYPLDYQSSSAAPAPRALADNAIFLDGSNGSLNSTTFPVTPLTFIGKAGAGGAGFKYSSYLGASNGGNGVIMIEMESAT